MRTLHGNGNGNGATERQCGHGLQKRLRKRMRMNGNKCWKPGVTQLTADAQFAESYSIRT